MYLAVPSAIRDAYSRHGIPGEMLRIGGPYQVRPLASDIREFDHWRASVGYGPIPVEHPKTVLDRYHALTDSRPTRLREARVRVVAYALDEELETVLGRGAWPIEEWSAEEIVDRMVESPLRLIGRRLSPEDRTRLIGRCREIESGVRRVLDAIWRVTLLEARDRLASNLAERDVVAASFADEPDGGPRVFRRGMDVDLERRISELEELEAWTRQRVRALLRG